MNKKLYGRKMSLEITGVDEAQYLYDVVLAGGTITAADISLNKTLIELDGTETPSLKVAFSVTYNWQARSNFADISIYNFNLTTMLKVVREGSKVKLSAGYKDGNFGVIFEGFVFQSTITRESVTDYVVTLRCVDDSLLAVGEYTTVNLPAGWTAQTVWNIFKTKGIDVDDSAIIALQRGKAGITPHVRGITVVGTPTEIMYKLLKMVNMKLPDGERTYHHIEKGKVYLGNEADSTFSTLVKISVAEGGLVGTPTQWQFGVNFTCLLEPSLLVKAPPVKVQLDMTGVKELAQTPGKGELTVLDRTGEYQVHNVIHEGDTRGNNWYSHVCAVNKDGKYYANLFPTTTE